MTATDQGGAARVPTEKNRGGEWITFGDEQYRVPPLAFRAVQELQDDVSALKDIGDRPTVAQMTTVEKLVHAAMSRNYPSLTLGQVSEMLDLGNYERVLNAVLSITGYTRAQEHAPGEAGASTGGSSTPP